MALHILSSSASSGAQVQEEGAADVIYRQQQAITLGQATGTSVQTGQTQATGGIPPLTVSVPGAGLSLPSSLAMIAPTDAVRLSNGEYVSKTDFQKLSPADQALLMQIGIEKFNQQKQMDLQNFLNNNVKLSTGEYISKADFAKLSPSDQQLLMTLGITKFNEQKQAEYNTFASQNTQLPNGEWIPNQFYNDLTPQAVEILRTGGTEAFNQWIIGKTPIDVFKDGGWKPDFNSPTPYAGMPFWYQAWESANFIPTASNPNPPSTAYTGGASTPPSTVSTVGVSTIPGEGVATWKPDFNSRNPYQGAPLSYYQQEINGYIPTASNPLPPSLSYIQANPLTQLVKPTETLTPQPFTQAEFIAYQMATPEQKFNLLMSKGYIPKGSEFAGVDDKGQVLYLTPENVLRNKLSDIWNTRVGQLQVTQQSKDYEQTHTRLADGQWIDNNQLNEIKSKYPATYELLITKGFAVAKENYEAQQSALAELSGYQTKILPPYRAGMAPEQIEALTKTGYDVSRYVLDNIDKPEKLDKARVLFGREYIDAIVSTKEYWTPDGNFNSYAALVGGVPQSTIKTITGDTVDVSIPPPFNEFAYEYYQQHPIISPINNKPIQTDANLTGIGMVNYPQWYREAGKRYEEIYGAGTVRPALARGITGEIVGGLVFEPIKKIIEPKYGAASVSTGEWISGGIQIATWVAPFALGKIIPLLPRIADVKIPTVEGDALVWKGLTVADNPIIGKSGSRIVFGRNIELPEATKILEGYKPEGLLDTKVFVNPSKLSKAGFSNAEIEKLTTTLRDRNLFAGEVSPFINKDVVLQPTARLDSDEINVLVKQMVSHADNINGADLLYGSSTIKGQLAPELRTWRDVHDWDIQTKMSQPDTEAFARDTLAKFQELSGGRQYRINPDKPTLIEKNIDGNWEHIADIHSKEIVPGVSEPASKLDLTGVRSYGRLVAEPAVTLEIPGVGKIDIMTLSESGVRKADTILRVRGTEFYPPERGVAAEGIPKDVADFYVILRTFKGKEIADEFAALWKLDPEVLLKTAMTDPPKFQYRITPSPTVEGELPSGKIVIPPSLRPSMPVSLYESISQPLAPYDVSALSQYAMQSQPISGSALISPSLVSVSPSVSGSVSVAPSPVTSGSVAVSPSTSPSPMPSPLASVTPTPSPSVKARPSPVPSPVPLPSAIPSPTPISPSPTPSPIPSPTPVSPSPSPSPSPVPSPMPTPPPIVPTPTVTKPAPPIKMPKMPDEWSKSGVPKGTIEWRQGRKWVVLPPPYDDTQKMYLDNPLPGTYKFAVGKGSAYKTLQVINGTGAEDADIDMGWATVHIRSKGKDLEMSFAGGEEAANDRWALEQEAMDELARQSYANLPQGQYMERIPVYRQPMSLNKQLIPEYSANGLKVYSVNGAYIRNRYANKSIGDRLGVDWAGGGHSGVYWNIIPQDEVWIDNTLQGEDRNAFILHEIEERDKMLNQGMDYSEAHNDYANKVEIEARTNPHEIDDMLDDLIAKHSKPLEPEVREKPKAIVRRPVSRSGGRTQSTNDAVIPPRYYLGTKLRPVSIEGE